MKLELIPYWKSAWRLWSVRFAALGAALWTYILAFPESAITIWNSLPPDLQSFIPSEWQRYVTLTIFVLTLVSRVVQQHKAQAIIETKMAERVDKGEVEKVTLFKPASSE